MRKSTYLGAVAAIALCAGTAAADVTIIHAGKVLAVPGEGYLNRQTIRIEDGMIVGIEAGYTRGDRGETVIDLKDSFVLPGLIDSHVHITSERESSRPDAALRATEADAALNGAGYALKTLRAGFTSVQDVGGSNEAVFSLRDAINAGVVPGPRLRGSGGSVTPTGGHGDANGYALKTLRAGFTSVQDVGGSNEAVFSLRDAINAGVVPGPRLRGSGGSVTPTGGHGDANGYSPDITALFSGFGACNGADDCRRAVRETVRSGADVIKITATGGVLSNTSAGLGQQFFDDELEAIVSTAHSMGRKVTAHAHGKEGIEAALRAGIDSIEHGTYLDDETIALFKENNATLVPTVIAGVTVTGWVDEDWLPEPSRKKAAIVGPLMLDMLARAKAGGVRIAFGTDSGVSKHGENADEFPLMIQAGFTPEEAIRAATVIGSEHIEMADQIGTIEAGKFADIIAVDGDPLADIEELLDVDFVMKNGTVYKGG